MKRLHCTEINLESMNYYQENEKNENEIQSVNKTKIWKSPLKNMFWKNKKKNKIFNALHFI